MKPLHYAVIPLRIVLGLAFAGMLVLQTLSFTGQWAYMASQHPEQAWLRWRLGMAGVQAAILPGADDPGMPFLLLAGAAVVLLRVVMRALLRQATNLRADMDAVI